MGIIPDGVMIATLGGCESMMMTPDECDEELNARVNAQMRQLYRLGCRRFRNVPLPRTGDPIRFKVMGWLS